MTDHSLQQSETIITAANATLTNCDREQVHIPGAIQPHGILFALQPSTLIITHVSSNIEGILGHHPEQILGRPLASLVGEAVIDSIQQCLSGDFEHVNPIPVELEGSNGPATFDGVVHQHNGAVIFELELSSTIETTSFFDFYRLVKTTLTELQKAQNLENLCQIVVDDIRHITGFDRVMIYRFDADSTGVVEAESRREDLEAFLGLRYPATDIPAPARRLYLLNWLRLIPDIAYAPADLISNSEVAEGPLDLSYSILRSVSPLHIEYLQNMGVQASMSISLVKEGKLWGLIACHHHEPRDINYNIRTSCEFLGQAMSLELVAKEENEDLQYKLQVKEYQAKLIDCLSTESSFSQSLVRNADALLALLSATGAAIYTDNGLSLIGDTPDRQQVEALIDWVSDKTKDDLYATQELPHEYPAAEQFKAVASGTIVLAVTRITKNFIVWFRPEVVQSVIWAGDPQKPAQIMADGILYLTPRQSFDRWQESVYGKSLQWKSCEIDSVFALKNAIVGTVLRQADALAELNGQLMTSNGELDAFAYAASHDLKEPLRGIYNYSSFLLEDFPDDFSEEGVSHLKAIAKLTQRMENLIDSLLHYSRLGRTELVKVPVNVSDLLKDIADLFCVQTSDDVTLQIGADLPTVPGDAVQLMEVFTNLISNAIKYNDNPQKHVEVGICSTVPLEAKLGGSDPNSITFYVKDNGIGIPEKHQANIFRLFKRIHSPKKYKSGTGVGLTLVKRIIERHGGSIAVISAQGEGSAFYITLPGSA
ncbi:MAG: ATP-binding protein [Elainellaceae cyanobacterium]